MGRVGFIDITVGNAARLGASQRSTTRRCASHHIATQRLGRWGSPAARARLARTVPLKRLWLRDGHVKRNTCERRRKFTVLWRTFHSTRTRRRREQYIPLVAFCLPHFLADFIICMWEFDFRQAHVFVQLARCGKNQSDDCWGAHDHFNEHGARKNYRRMQAPR